MEAQEYNLVQIINVLFGGISVISGLILFRYRGILFNKMKRRYPKGNPIQIMTLPYILIIIGLVLIVLGFSPR
jgi:hypothetical protein